MSIEEIKEASITAVELIGNASAKISHLRREKLVTSINKSLVHFVKEDSDFSEWYQISSALSSPKGKRFCGAGEDPAIFFSNQTRPAAPQATFLGEGNSQDKGRKFQSIKGRPK